MRELEETFKKLPKATRTEMQRELRGIGAMVRDEIRSRTPVQDASRDDRRRMRQSRVGRSGGRDYDAKHRPGTLKRGTVSRLRFLRVEVINVAKRYSRKYPGGYRYGKRLEFDPAYSGRYAFFYPGYEAKKAEAVDRFRDVLDRIAKRYWASKLTGGK